MIVVSGSAMESFDRGKQREDSDVSFLHQYFKSFRILLTITGATMACALRSERRLCVIPGLAVFVFVQMLVGFVVVDDLFVLRIPAEGTAESMRDVAKMPRRDRTMSRFGRGNARFARLHAAQE